MKDNGSGAERTVGLDAMRAYRLGRVRAELNRRDIAAALFFDPVNIRYATDCTNMQVWTLHNPARYCLVFAAALSFFGNSMAPGIWAKRCR